MWKWQFLGTCMHYLQVKVFSNVFYNTVFSNTKMKIGRQGQGLSRWESKSRFDCCWMHLERSRFWSLLAASPFGSLDKFKGQFNLHDWNFGTKGRILTIRHFQMLAFSLFLKPNLAGKVFLFLFFLKRITNLQPQETEISWELKFYKKIIYRQAFRWMILIGIFW